MKRYHIQHPCFKLRLTLTASQRTPLAGGHHPDGWWHVADAQTNAQLAIVAGSWTLGAVLMQHARPNFIVQTVDAEVTAPDAAMERIPLFVPVVTALTGRMTHRGSAAGVKGRYDEGTS